MAGCAGCAVVAVGTLVTLWGAEMLVVLFWRGSQVPFATPPYAIAFLVLAAGIGLIEAGLKAR